MTTASRPALSWQQRRSAFNHDWLQNQLSQLVGSALDFVRGSFEEEGFAARFPGKLVSQWERHRGQAVRLAAEFEVQMSPRVCLDRPPLSQLQTATRQWLGAVTHGCWLARGSKRRLIEDVLEAERGAEQAFAALHLRLARLNPAKSPADLAPALPDLEELDRCCRALSRAISRLPNRLEVG